MRSGTRCLWRWPLGLWLVISFLQHKHTHLGRDQAFMMSKTYVCLVYVWQHDVNSFSEANYLHNFVHWDRILVWHQLLLLRFCIWRARWNMFTNPFSQCEYFLHNFYFKSKLPLFLQRHYKNAATTPSLHRRNLDHVLPGSSSNTSTNVVLLLSGPFCCDFLPFFLSLLWSTTSVPEIKKNCIV